MVLPYLNGFVYILVLSVLVNGLVFIIGLLLKYICRLFKYLTIGIKEISLAKEGRNFCLFLQIVF
jgi:hypothetical protein